jgi:hypothetical protein
MIVQALTGKGGAFLELEGYNKLSVTVTVMSMTTANQCEMHIKTARIHTLLAMGIG